MDNNTQLSRREFCFNLCQAAALVAVGGTLSALLPGCNSSNPVSAGGQALPLIPAVAVNGVITLALDANSPLAASGSAAQVQYGGGILLVAHTAQEAFTALTAVCTHQGCTITNYSNQNYVCPCHGSQFDTNGKVKQGPASTALRQYTTQFANAQLQITVG